jgi:hypothetical protein
VQAELWKLSRQCRCRKEERRRDSANDGKVENLASD